MTIALHVHAQDGNDANSGTAGFPFPFSFFSFLYNQTMSPMAVSSVTLAPTADTYIDQANPTTNFNTNVVGLLTEVAGTNDKRILMKFDVSAYAAEDIDSASLWVNMNGAQPANQTYAIRRLVREDWTPGTVDWVNYNINGGTLPWTTAGCANDGTDYTSTGEVTGTLLSTGNGLTNIGDVKALVVDAINNRSGILHLLFQCTQNKAGNIWSFHSQNAEPTDNGPELVLGILSSRHPLLELYC